MSKKKEKGSTIQINIENLNISFNKKRKKSSSYGKIAKGLIILLTVGISGSVILYSESRPPQKSTAYMLYDSRNVSDKMDEFL